MSVILSIMMEDMQHVFMIHSPLGLSSPELGIKIKMQEIALDFVLDNMEGVKGTPGFLELKQEPDLLMEIIFRQAS